MANSRTRTPRRRSSSPRSAAGLPWVSELQLDAYLQARDALRRARSAALLASAPHPHEPPATPA